MRIRRVTAHNILGVEDIDFTLNGHHLFLIGGKNASGKTSTLQSLVIALCGKRGCDYPEVPLRDGEDEGVTRIEMDGAEEWFSDVVTVERTFERRKDGSTKESLVILADDGEEAPQPQTLLNDLYEHRGFDPLAFSRLKAKDQLEELKKIVDLDLSEFDKERERLYEERSGVNRDVKTLKGKLKGMIDHLDVPAEALAPNDLIEEIQRQMDHNAANASKRNALQALRSEHTRISNSITVTAEELKRAQEQVGLLERRLADLRNEQHDNQEKGQDLAAECDDLQDFDVDEVRRELDQLEDTNAKVRHNQQRAELRQTLRKAEQKSDMLTDEIKAIDSAKTKALKEAEWPIDGLAYDGDGVTFEGVPFAQCSAAEKIRISVAMGMAAHPRLKMLVIQNGECMDDESLAIIDKLASENDYQLLVEYMTRSTSEESRCQIVIEDGKSREPIVEG